MLSCFRFTLTTSGSLHIRDTVTDDGFARFYCQTVHRLTGEKKLSMPGQIVINRELRQCLIITVKMSQFFIHVQTLVQKHIRYIIHFSAPNVVSLHRTCSFRNWLNFSEKEFLPQLYKYFWECLLTWNMWITKKNNPCSSFISKYQWGIAFLTFVHASQYTRTVINMYEKVQISFPFYSLI